VLRSIGIDAGFHLVEPGSPSTDVALLLPKADRHVTLTIVTNVKKRRRGASKISSKNQITIPADALRNAGLEAGDRVIAHADGAGRVILEREHNVVAEFAGALTGIYRSTELDDLRSEWD
jgi:AbrB family looped-hinge helix DNA binding protein